MEESDIIRELTRSAGPVRRLSRPWLRALVWIALSLPAALLVVLAMGLRPNLPQKLGDPRFLVEQAAALATAATAAFAAFCAVIPGRRPWLLLLPLPAVAVWLGSLAEACLNAWMLDGRLTLALDWLCLPNIALVGAIPALAMAVMIRKGAPLFPHAAVALGGLAAAALGDFGLRLFHPVDASLMVLVWQLGSVAILTILASAAGPLVLRWKHRAA